MPGFTNSSPDCVVPFKRTYSFKLQIHAHIYRSFIRHHKMLGVRIAKRKTSLKSRAKANPCGTKLRARIFFGAGKFASQTYPAGELKSKGNRRYAASGGRSEPVSRKRRCLWFSKGHKQQCRDGVHPSEKGSALIAATVEKFVRSHRSA